MLRLKLEGQYLSFMMFYHNWVGFHSLEQQQPDSALELWERVAAARDCQPLNQKLKHEGSMLLMVRFAIRVTGRNMKKKEKGKSRSQYFLLGK